MSTTNDFATLGVKFDTADGVSNLDKVEAATKRVAASSESMFSAEQRAAKAAEVAAREQAQYGQTVSKSHQEAATATEKATTAVERNAEAHRKQSEEVKKSKDEMEDYSSSISKTAIVITALGTALAGAAAGFTYKVNASIVAEEHLLILSQRTKLAVTELAGLKLAAETGNTTIDQLAQNIKFLNISMVEARTQGSRAAEAFEFLKLDPSSFKSASDALLQVGAALMRVEDNASRSAVAQILLRRSFEELIPFFAQGETAIKQMTEQGQKLNPVTQESARLADEFGDNLKILSEHGAFFARTVAQDVVPALNRLASGLIAAKNAGFGFWNSLGGALSGAMVAPEKLRDEISKTAGALKVLQDNFNRDAPTMGAGTAAIQEAIILRGESRLAAMRAQLDAWNRQGMPDFSDVNTRGQGAITGNFAREARGGSSRQQPDEFKAADSYIKSLEERLANINGEGSEVEKTIRRIFDLDQKFNESQRNRALEIALELDNAIAKRKQDEAQRKADEQAEKEIFDTRAKSLDAINKEIEQTRKLTAEVGKSKAERIAMEAEMLDARIRSLEAERIAAQADADADAIEQDDKAAAATNRYVEALRKEIEALRELQREKGQYASAQKMEEERKQAEKDAKEAAEATAKVWRNAAREMESAMSSFFFDVMSGKTDQLGKKFADTVRRMLADWLALQTKILLFGEQFSGGKSANVGGLLGGLAARFFGGGGDALDSYSGKGVGDMSENFFEFGASGYASGGNIRGPAWVGERGPEIFMPDTPGRIISNEAILAGGKGAPTFNIDARGADVAAVRRLELMVRELNGNLEERAVTAVVRSAREGGTVSRSIRS